MKHGRDGLCSGMKRKALSTVLLKGGGAGSGDVVAILLGLEIADWKNVSNTEREVG